MNSPVSPASLAGIKLNLPKQRGAYYDGKWHEPKNGRYVDTPNPATSESLGKVADELNIEGVHLFTFNNIKDTADWQRTMLAKLG